MLKRSVVHRFLLLLGTADSEWDFVVWHGLSSEGMGCFSKLPKCMWQSILFWASCAFSWKCFGLRLLYGILFERGIQDLEFSSSRAWQEGQLEMLAAFFPFPLWSAGRISL